MLRFISALIFAALLQGCSQEMLPFSSGQLEGTVVPGPEDWRPVAAREVVQLESQPSEPYSVNIWVLGEESHLYVFAGGTKANWIEHIEVDPNVRMKIGESIYELKAERVLDPDEFERFAQGWESKYGRRPWNEDVNDTYLMRLTAR